MVLSVVLCLLASSLMAYFLYPRSVVVVDDGIHAVIVRFDHSNKRVLMNMTVGFFFSHNCSSQCNEIQFSSATCCSLHHDRVVEEIMFD